MKSPPPLLENEKDPKSEPLSLSFYNKSAFLGNILFHVGRCSGLKGWWVRGYGKKFEYLSSFIQGTFLLLLLARHSIRRYILHHIRTTIKAAKAHTEDQETSQPPPLSLFMGVGCVCV